jgi:hypothetical protein
LRASPALRADLGERGYQAFLQHWTRDAHMRQYFNLLEEISLEKLGHALGAA